MMLMTTYQSMASLAGTTKHYLKELMGAIGWCHSQHQSKSKSEWSTKGVAQMVFWLGRWFSTWQLTVHDAKHVANCNIAKWASCDYGKVIK
jgi:hypothetical protein